jgi:pimeloyl-ACP methyl ester carboxylesterase
MEDDTMRPDRGRWEQLTTALCWLQSEVPAVATAALAMGAGDGAETLDAPSRHRIPVVFVHGLFGHATNFHVLRRHLAARGIGRFASYSYLPRLDFARLAPRLAEHVEDICEATGAPAVDVVGHSLGGLIARYLVLTRPAVRIRRLVTMGSPHFGGERPLRELGIFGRLDPLVPPPTDRHACRTLVVPDCGHLGLLRHPRVLRVVARYLARPERRGLEGVARAA